MGIDSDFDALSDVLLSASQIKLYRECPRKWGWKYIAGIETPPNPAALLGTEVDDTQLQPYLREGRPLDFSRPSGYIAAAGMAYLPQPMADHLEVQRRFQMPSPTRGIQYQGYVDLWMPLGGMPGIEGFTPAVCDFKTTSNFKYALTSELLGRDVQAQLYALWAMRETRAPEVDLVWIYFLTKGAHKARRVHLRVTGEHVAKQFSEIDLTAREIRGTKSRVKDPLELEPRTEMCEAYGGCPHRHRCNLSPGDVMDSLATKNRKKEDMSEESSGTAGLLAGLRKRKELKPTEADMQFPPIAEIPEPSPAPTPPFPVVEVQAVGINPPEAALPPPQEKPKASKPKPTKAKEEDVPLDLSIGTIPVLSVTWAEETFCIVPYSPVKVGPYRLVREVKPSESMSETFVAMNKELTELAEKAREAKLTSFLEAIKGLGK